MKTKPEVYAIVGVNGAGGGMDYGVCGTIRLNGDSIAQDEGGIYIYGNKGHLHLPCANFMGKDVAPMPSVQDMAEEQMCFL